MKTSRAVVIILLVVGLCACKSASGEKEAAALITKANGVWDQTDKTTKAWTTEYANAFGPEKRAKFPANRASLQTSAGKIVKLLDEETRITNEAIEQYERANALITGEQKRHGVSLLISSLRKTLRSYEFLKLQLQIVYDESIVDAKTFEERFQQLGGQFGKALRESQAEFDEGRRILGI
jgi:hypothetical protein